LPSQYLVLKDGDSYIPRYKTSKGFNLAQLNMKGCQRKMDFNEALSFSKKNKFLLIDGSDGERIKYRFLKTPNRCIYKDIQEE